MTCRAPGLDANQVAALRLDLDKLLGGLRSGSTEGTPAPGDDERSVPTDIDAALDAAQDDLATDLYAFMAMYMKIAQQMRSTAREQRAAELQSQVASLESAADHMVQAAQERFNAALTSGIFQIASGAISIGSAIGTLRAMAKPDPGGQHRARRRRHRRLLDQQGQPRHDARQRIHGRAEGQAGPRPAAVPRCCPHGRHLLRRPRAAGGAGDANAKRDEADASAAQARRDAAQEVMQTMADTIKDIRDKLAAMVQSQIETNRGIARNI